MPRGTLSKFIIENSLLRTGALIQLEKPEDFPEDVQKKLEEAAALMDPNLAEAVKAVLDPVEKRLTEIKAKIADLEENPNYLLDFKMGGVSGAALRPIMVRCIYDIYKSVSIPIIG